MSQTDKLLNLLSDRIPHRTDEILLKCYGDDHYGLSRVGARIYDLKQKGFEIEGHRDKKRPSLYWYQLKSLPVSNNGIVSVYPPMRSVDNYPPTRPKGSQGEFFKQDQHGEMI